MDSGKQVIQELESRRKSLNERFMNSKTVAEANNIERELWALRTAIRYHKSVDAKKRPNSRKS